MLYYRNAHDQITAPSLGFFKANLGNTATVTSAAVAVYTHHGAVYGRWRARSPGEAGWHRNVTSASDKHVPINVKAVTTAVTGTLASTLDGVTMSASGTETFTGTFSSTLQDATMAASGTETFTGTFTSTLQDATMTASGLVAEPVTGTFTSTLGDVTISASGVETMEGSLASTLDGVTMAASGDAIDAVTGTLASTLDGVSMSATGSAAAELQQQAGSPKTQYRRPTKREARQALKRIREYFDRREGNISDPERGSMEAIRSEAAAVIHGDRLRKEYAPLAPLEYDAVLSYFAIMEIEIPQLSAFTDLARSNLERRMKLSMQIQEEEDIMMMLQAYFI